MGKSYKLEASGERMEDAETSIKGPTETDIKILAFFGNAPRWLENIHYYYVDNNAKHDQV